MEVVATEEAQHVTSSARDIASQSPIDIDERLRNPLPALIFASHSVSLSESSQLAAYSDASQESSEPAETPDRRTEEDEVFVSLSKARLQELRDRRRDVIRLLREEQNVRQSAVTPKTLREGDEPLGKESRPDPTSFADLPENRAAGEHQVYRGLHGYEKWNNELSQQLAKLRFVEERMLGIDGFSRALDQLDFPNDPRGRGDFRKASRGSIASAGQTTKETLDGRPKKTKTTVISRKVWRARTVSSTKTGFSTRNANGLPQNSESHLKDQATLTTGLLQGVGSWVASPSNMSSVVYASEIEEYFTTTSQNIATKIRESRIAGLWLTTPSLIAAFPSAASEISLIQYFYITQWLFENLISIRLRRLLFGAILVLYTNHAKVRIEDRSGSDWARLAERCWWVDGSQSVNYVLTTRVALGNQQTHSPRAFLPVADGYQAEHSVDIRLKTLDGRTSIHPDKGVISAPPARSTRPSDPVVRLDDPVATKRWTRLANDSVAGSVDDSLHSSRTSSRFGQNDALYLGAADVQKHIFNTLPGDLAAFCSLGYDQYASCVTFCLKRPDLWDQANRLPPVARRLLERTDGAAARTVVSRYLMLALSGKKAITHRGRIEWLSNLITNGKAREEFELYCSRTVEQLERDQANAGRDKNGILTTGNIPMSYAKTASVGIARQNTTPTKAAIAPVSNLKSIESVHEVPRRSASLLTHLASERRNGRRESSSEIPNLNSVTGGRAKLRKREFQSVATSESSLPIQNKLPGDFKVYHGSAAINRVFAPGSLIAVFWHENLGLSLKAATTLSSLPDTAADQRLGNGFVSRGPQDELIYSHVKRFVIVSKRDGHSVGVPVTSYSGRGVSAKRLPLREQHAHAIIYARGKSPISLQGEPRFSKDPICVRITAQSQSLSESARINYARVTNIDHNIKIRYIGNVVGEDIAMLLKSFKEEFLGSLNIDGTLRSSEHDQN